jgi:sulfate adenylyltransferase large subunit
MGKDTLKIVFTGHVDHGKSTLIGRLLIDTNSLPEEKISEIRTISRQLGKDAELAFVTDYLKEEREQNITIDTTQIFFKTRRRDYVIIDAPGHVEFIKNMITGTSQAEAAVLLVDASEGVMEQTRRHAYLISMLGLERVVIAVNKMDLVNYSEKIFYQVTEDLGSFLKHLDLIPVYNIPLSAKEGENISERSKKMKWYSGPHFLKSLGSFQKVTDSTENKPLRFPIQDVYTVKGEKIAAGRIESGYMYKKQGTITLPPGGKNSVASIKVFGKEKKSAETYESIGIVLEHPEDLKRGFILVDDRDPPVLDNIIKASVFWMKEEPLYLNKPKMLRCATQEVECMVERVERKIDTSTLEVIDKNIDKLMKYEVGEVYIRTTGPIIVEKFSFLKELGGFILKDKGDIAGLGIVR